MRRVYLAGPMRGYPEFNFPAFKFAAEKLRGEGFEVFSPAEKGGEEEFQKDPSLATKLAARRHVFALDWDWIAKHADAVALLPGWEKSSGARSERACAEAVGLSVIILGSEYAVN